MPVSELIVIVFSSEAAATQARDALVMLQYNARTTPEDIVLITRKAAGKITLQQSIERKTGKTLGDGRWGMLIGTMFLDERDPNMKKAKGLSYLLGKTGLDASFIREVSQALVSGGAAVGMRRQELSAKVMTDTLAKLPEPGRVIRTLLSPEVEANLEAMQDQIPDSISLG